MISMKELISEMVHRRVNLMKVDVILEKLLPELGDDAENFQRMYAEITMDVDTMNKVPTTKFNVMEWVVTIGHVLYKLDMLKEEAARLAAKHDSIEFAPLFNALDELLTY